MTITTRTSELEAVNTILSTVGEAPLNSLTGSLPVDGTMARNVLNEINREVQSHKVGILIHITKQHYQEMVVIKYQ
jgi:hypothetical protein